MGFFLQTRPIKTTQTVFFLMCHLTDLELGELDVQRQEDAGAAEDMFVDKETVDKLTEGLLAHYLPDLQKSQGTLHELT